MHARHATGSNRQEESRRPLRLSANVKWGVLAAILALATYLCGVTWAARAHWWIRLGLPGGDGWEPVGAVVLTLRLTALSSLLTSCLVLFLASRRPRLMARDLHEAAERMARGDFSVRTQPIGDDELAEAGRALDRLAVSLETTLADLHRERAVQGQILDEMQEGVLVLDRDGRVVMMNPAFRSMLLLGTEAKGKLLLEVVRHAELHEIVSRARAGRTTALGEIDLPGIKPRRLLTHATAFAGEAGGLLAVFVDVTDLRRLESLRRDFVANVSHELRTPVTAMRSAAETLRVSALCDGDVIMATRFVEIIERNGERLQSLIEDLMELSRLESKEFRLKKEDVDLGVVASIVLGLFRERARQEGGQDPGGRRRRCLAPRHRPARARAGHRQPGRQRHQVLPVGLDRDAGQPGSCRGPCASWCATPGRGSTRRTCRGCSSGSTGRTPAVRATSAAPASGSRSSSTWSRRWKGR